jgi:hypothetical protein
MLKVGKSGEMTGCGLLRPWHRFTLPNGLRLFAKALQDSSSSAHASWLWLLHASKSPPSVYQLLRLNLGGPLAPLHRGVVRFKPCAGLPLEEWMLMVNGLIYLTALSPSMLLWIAFNLLVAVS